MRKGEHGNKSNKGDRPHGKGEEGEPETVYGKDTDISTSTPNTRNEIIISHNVLN